jgi:hypothetical protein
MHDGEQDKSKPDPNPYGGVWHSITGIVLKAVLWVVYLSMRIYYRGKITTPPATDNSEDIPDEPIPSLQLAMALDPKTPEHQLIDLVGNDSYHVRRALARNPTLPTDCIEILRRDENESVSLEIEHLYPLQNDGSKGQ